MLCKRCGTEIPDTSKYCPECGVKIWKPQTPQEKLADELHELRYKNKMNIITDMEYERRKYNLLHPDAVKPAPAAPAPQAASEPNREALAEQLREIRDLFKLNIISEMEYERRKYNLLHPVKNDEKKEIKVTDEAVARQEILADQLREIRDWHKLNILSDTEYELRRYNLLHPAKDEKK